jgi:Rrf2 family protein
MLSSKAKYALRALLRLADNAAAGSWLQTGDVAEQEQVPRKFLEAIFVQLRDQGIIESRRGAQGGYRLARNPAAVSVADVIRILDGPLALTPCASRTRFHQCADCVDIRQCRLQALMREARDAVAGVLESCSLAELAGKPAAKARRPARMAAATRSKPQRLVQKPRDVRATRQPLAPLRG